MTTDRDALYRAICAQPDEDTPRLAFADLLDEEGEPDRARFVRTQVELARVPDVVRVSMTTGPGDVIGTRLHSASTTGLVYLAVADEDLVYKRVQELASAYVLDVVPVSSP